jgi:hypothetical protein
LQSTYNKYKQTEKQSLKTRVSYLKNDEKGLKNRENHFLGIKQLCISTICEAVLKRIKRLMLTLPHFGALFSFLSIFER